MAARAVGKGGCLRADSDAYAARFEALAMTMTTASWPRTQTTDLNTDPGGDVTAAVPTTA
jgi:hypothetical protein